MKKIKWILVFVIAIGSATYFISKPVIEDYQKRSQFHREVEMIEQIGKKVLHDQVLHGSYPQTLEALKEKVAFTEKEKQFIKTHLLHYTPPPLNDTKYRPGKPLLIFSVPNHHEVMVYYVGNMTQFIKKEALDKKPRRDE